MNFMTVVILRYNTSKHYNYLMGTAIIILIDFETIFNRIFNIKRNSLTASLAHKIF